ncbi:MAG: SUMF1/EgtB/PvdO family nonheme iron enzyme [Phycisphaeraceae bacterium]|nr:SUMF1/EgtB/PvdO family nonheme iron enzyme [Phycisphaeraceae bacterium]
MICAYLLGCAMLTSTARAADVILIAPDERPDFAAAIQQGIEQAKQQLAAQGTTINLTVRHADTPGDRNSLAQLIDSVSPENCDGLMLSALDSKALRDAVNAASSRGIKLVMLDVGVCCDGPVSRVASANRQAGWLAARCLAESLGGSADIRLHSWVPRPRVGRDEQQAHPHAGVAPQNDSGGALMLRNQIDSMSAEEREEGFLEMMLSSYPGITLVATDFHNGPSRQSARRICGNLLTMHEGKVAGICATTQETTLGALDALREKGLAGGKVKLVGVNEGGSELAQAMAAGDLIGYVELDGRAIGCQGLLSLAAALNDKTVEPLIRTDVALITPQGVMPPPAQGPHHDSPPAATRPTTRLSEGDFVIPDLNLIMKAIPAGSFMMGATDPQNLRGDEQPQHKVTLSAFWLGQCEVTQAQWRAVMGNNPSAFVGDDLPVESISWEDAMAFCQKLNQREAAAGRLPQGLHYTLPTEAQWEYAARAGTTSSYVGDPQQTIWYSATSGQIDPTDGQWHMSPHPVASKLPNAWGLYDMQGNVLERCFDCYAEYSSADQVDPQGPPDGKYRSLRGGGWWADLTSCATHARHRGPSQRAHSAVGMRLALSPL